MKRRLSREVREAGLGKPVGSTLVTRDEIEGLPDTVRRYLIFMGVVGRPRDWAFCATLRGRVRLGPDQSWMPIEAEQYDTALEVARFFHMKARLFGVLPVLARDTYVKGHGRMLVKALDLFTVADGQGYEFDLGELVTYLNDAILLAPSMLLGPNTEWAAGGSDAFDVALTDGELRVTARVVIDERGAVRSFETMDRFVQDPFDRQHRLVRARWTTPVVGWQNQSGRQLPTGGSAVWHLAQGDFKYVEIQFSDVVFNIAPSSTSRQAFE